MIHNLYISILGLYFKLILFSQMYLKIINLRCFFKLKIALFWQRTFKMFDILPTMLFFSYSLISLCLFFSHKTLQKISVRRFVYHFGVHLCRKKRKNGKNMFILQLYFSIFHVHCSILNCWNFIILFAKTAYKFVSRKIRGKINF